MTTDLTGVKFNSLAVLRAPICPYSSVLTHFSMSKKSGRLSQS